jgi:hypothetical protein
MQAEIRESRKSVRRSLAGFPGWKSLALLAMAATTALLGRAQLAGTGAIAGTVTDSTGAVVANATVTVTSAETNETTVRTTTGAGDFNVTPLTPGVYTVTITAQGFRTFVQQNVTVNALQTVPLDIKLAIGQSIQTVTVSTAPPVLETTDATLGAVMDNQMYSSLPLLMGAGGNADQRRATDFAALMPGVQTNYIGSGNATDASGAVNGGNPAGGTAEIYIDGINLPEADGIGDPRFTWTAFGMDAIDQFQVQTSGYSAQYAGQGVQNYSIKQGSNAWHGGVYEYIRNTVLDAWKFTSKVPTVTGIVPAGQSCVFGSAPSSYCAPGGVKPAEIMNEVGAKFGGPIIHNKLFMFYNYGQYRNQNGPTIKLQTIPTTAMLNGDFSGYSTATGYNIYDPGSQTPGCLGSGSSTCTRAQFVSTGGVEPAGTLNVIPASRISGAATYINKYMQPYEATTLQTQYSNNIATGYANGLANWYQGGRIDYDMSDRNQVSIIVAFGRQASTGPNSSGAANQLGPPFNTNQSYTPKTTVDIVKDTFTINPHIVNVAAVAYGRYKSLSVNPNDAPQFAASQTGLLNTPAGQASYFPLISFSNNTSCPPTSGGGVDNPCNEGGYDWNQKVNNTYTASDNLQWQLGKHNLTFGGQVAEVEFNYIKNLTFSSPLTYTFANTQTAGWAASGTSLNSSSGSSVASYLLGAVSTSSITVGVPGLGTRWLDPSIWAQDDYKISPRLTLNLGLRWDIWPAIHETHNLITWLDPTGANSVTGNLGTLAFAGGSSSDGFHTGMPIPSSTFYGNIGPRVGFAYELGNKTVIRSSYSLDFARGDWTSGSQSGSPSTTGLAPSASAAAGTVNQPSFYWDGTACANSTADGVACGWTGSIATPAPPAGGTSLAEFGTSETTALTNSGAVSPTYWDPHYGSRTPEYINWTFGVERQLTPNMSISVSYVGSEGHFLSTGSNKAIGSRNNELPESLAALAGYNVVSGTAVACSGTGCTTPLLTQTAGPNAGNSMANIALATGLGFTPPNPYNASNATYYYKDDVYQYFEPFPQYSGVSDTTGFMGNENWNAVEISLRQRPSHGFNMMINYTYSKSIDDLGTFRVGDNDRLDRSLSTADLPQNLVGTVVYQLPVGRGHWMGDNLVYRSILSDWTASGIFSDHSGFPIAVTGSGCGTAGILNQCMPSIVAGQAGRQNGAYGKNVTAAPGSPNYIGNVQYINPAAFTVAINSGSASGQGVDVGPGPALYVPGNAPRVGAFNMWGMGYYDADVAIKRTFPVYHEWNLAFELDMTNVTNHVVWASPSAVVASGTNANFGTITALSSANAPRDVQGSLRINF